MAIPKVKSNKVEWSTQSIVQFSVSGGLIVLSLIMGWLAIARFQLKRNLVAGLQAMDRNQEGDVEPYLQSAVGWKKSHVGARLALAKRYADSGKLDDGEALYRELLADPDLEEKGLVGVGLGVIALKRAEKEKDATQFKNRIKEAQAAYGTANHLPEGKLGIKLADLMREIRDKNADGVAKLQAAFTGLINDAKSGKSGQWTREGLIDLYAGAGMSYAYGGGYSKEAAQYFNSCYSLAPQWPLPLVNKVYLEAAYLRAGSDIPPTKLQEMKTAWDTEKNDWDSKATSPAYIALREAWFQYCIAQAYRYGSAGLIQEYRNYIHQLKSKSDLNGRYEVIKVHLGIFMHFGMRPGIDPESRNNDVMQASTEIENFLKGELSRRSEAEWVTLKALALANFAVCLEHRGVREMNNNFHQEAVKNLKEALEIEKKSLGLPDGAYETNRNLAVILKRLNNAEGETYYNAAVKLGPGSDKGREDVENLKKFWAGQLKE